MFTHLQSLLKLTAPVKSKGPGYIRSLWTLRDEINSHIRSIESLGVEGNQCEIFLTPIILSRLPSEITLEWARNSKGHEADLQYLLDFLKDEIERLERSESVKDFAAETKPKDEVKKMDFNKPNYSGSALVQARSQSEIWCNFCSKRGHYTDRCKELLDLQGEARYLAIQRADLCFRCLKKSHHSRICPSKRKCSKCGGNHNLLMCDIRVDRVDSRMSSRSKEIQTQTEEKKVNLATMSSLTNSKVKNCAILQTA